MARSKKPPVPSAKPHPKGPSEIAPGVFVGGWNDALQFQGARFCVLDEAPEEMPTATHVPVYNEEAGQASTENLDRLAEAMRTARAKGEPVLVFCGHGARRSPLGGAWYLRRTEGLSLNDAYDRIRAVRPKVEHAREWVGNANELERS
ncbi:MAG: dual specificity protein phosphatase family protein [Thermoplasmata archaeon]